MTILIPRKVESEAKPHGHLELDPSVIDITPLRDLGAYCSTASIFTFNNYGTQSLNSAGPGLVEGALAGGDIAFNLDTNITDGGYEVRSNAPGRSGYNAYQAFTSGLMIVRARKLVNGPDSVVNGAFGAFDGGLNTPIGFNFAPENWGGGITVRVSDGTTHQSRSFGAEPGDWVNVVIQIIGTDKAFCAVNGEFHEFSPLASGPYWLNNHFKLGRCRAATNEYLRGETELAVFLPEVEITEDLAVALSENPYQILKSRSKYGILPTAVGNDVILTVDPGAYTVVGTDVNLVKDTILSLESGTYVYTGFDAGLSTAAIIVAGTGAYTVAGAEVALLRALKAAAESGSYSLVGSDVSLRTASALSLDAGSYALAGSSVGLLLDSLLGLDSGSYSTVGFDVTLAQDLSIVLSSGNYTLAGSAAGLLTSLVLALAPGAYTVTGSDAGLGADTLLGAGAGSYALAGSDISLIVDSLLALAAGSYTITGTDAALLKSSLLVLTSGAYTLTGSSVVLSASGALALAAESGAYNLTGQQVTFLQDVISQAEGGAYIVDGKPATLAHITAAVNYIRAILLGL